MTVLSIYLVVSALTTLTWSIVLRRGRNLAELLRGFWARHTVRELLGWMTVVAVVAAAARSVDLTIFKQTAAMEFLLIIAFVGSAALLMALHSPSCERHSRWVIAASALLSASVVVMMYANYGSEGGGSLALGSYGYVAAWLLVQRLDQARLARTAR